MVVGFISLSLTVGSKYVSMICVPEEWTHIMRQCRLPKELQEHQNVASAGTESFGQSCSDKGKADFIHLESLHQLHVFIFCLAVVHVVYSVLIMVLGMWKVYQWRYWEEMSDDAENLSTRGGVRYTKNTTFIKRHVTGAWSKNYILSHIAAFFQQFYHSVSSTDFLTLRHGFIMNHKLQNFNFHMYIVKSLEEDFKHVVGISLCLWGYMVILILVNVEGWGAFYWTSLIPFVVVLAVGAKLRYIITQMAIVCLEKHEITEGLPAVKPSDDLFWFGRPKLVLSLIHFVLFQDALEVAVHLWSKFTFDEPNCFNRSNYLLAGRLILGLISQVLCGYVVLPIYALVSQMGSQMKEHEDMELCVARLCKEDSENSTSLISSKEGNVVVVNADSITPLHEGEVEHGGMESEGGEDSIVEVDTSVVDGIVRVERKMSYIERKARGVHGEDYYTLKP